MKQIIFRHRKVNKKQLFFLSLYERTRYQIQLFGISYKLNIKELAMNG